MPIPVLTKLQLQNVLAQVGVQPGDGLMIHSAMQFLGQPEGGLPMVLQTLLEVVTAQGTLAAPAFNFGFARGLPFDPAATPSESMGVLVEEIRGHPAARRTPHPMQSLALIGYYADELAACDTSSAFDPGSAFERLLDLDFKLLLLGASVEFVSMIHYCEQKAGVPYRYWKEFTGQVRGQAGWQKRTIRMFARDLELNPVVQIGPVQRLLEQRGLWRSQQLNFGRVALCRLNDFVRAADDLLAADPWALVKKK